MKLVLKMMGPKAVVLEALKAATPETTPSKIVDTT